MLPPALAITTAPAAAASPSTPTPSAPFLAVALFALDGGLPAETGRQVLTVIGRLAAGIGLLRHRRIGLAGVLMGVLVPGARLAMFAAVATLVAASAPAAPPWTASTFLLFAGCRRRLFRGFLGTFFALKAPLHI